MTEEVICSECGATWAADLDLKYCGQCRAALKQTSPEVSSKERRNLCVLFADLSGFTSFSEGKDPEEVEEIVDQLFSHLSNVIRENGGYVDKYMGDCIMAVFGAPQAHEDDPLRAVLSGLEIVDEFSRFVEDKHDELSIRVGINQGEVMWSRVGGGDYTATGDAVNVAQRLESEAEPNSVLVNQTIQEHTHHRILYRKREPVRLEGRKTPVLPFVAIEGKELNQPAPEIKEGDVVSPLLGRTAELNQLTRRYESEGASFLAIYGPAGIGKSRLIHTFRNQVENRTSSVMVGKGACDPHTDLPLKPFGDLLLENVEEGRADPQVGRKLIEAIMNDFEGSSFGEVRRTHFAHLIVNSIGLEVPEASVTDLSPEAKREETVFAWINWFREIIGDRIGVVTLEDLHWADASTMNLLTRLYEYFPSSSEFTFRETVSNPSSTSRDDLTDILILTTFRPHGEVPDGFEKIELNPFDQNECRSIAESRLDAPVTDQTTTFLHKQTGGNPYFLEELIRYIIEEGNLNHADQPIDLTPASGETVPDTLNGLLVGRIDRLAFSTKETVKQASVIGRKFWVRLLEDVINQSIRGDLQVLETRKMVFEMGQSDLPGDEEYIFKHALLRDAAYRLLPTNKRLKIHSLISEKLEEFARERTSNPSSTEEQKEHEDPADTSSEEACRESRLDRNILTMAADHATKAEETARAGRLWIEAARAAKNENAMDEAIELAQKAMDTPQEIDARLILGEAYLHFGEQERVLKYLEGLIESDINTSPSPGGARPNGGAKPTDEQLTEARLKVTNAYSKMDQFEEALQQIQIIRSSSASERFQIDARLRKSRIFRQRSRFNEAEELLRETLRLIRENDEDHPERERNVLNELGLTYWYQGRLEKALDCFQEAFEGMKGQEDPLAKADLLNNIGFIQKRQGMDEGALEKLRHALSIYREVGHRKGEADALNNLGLVHLHRREFEKADGVFRQSLDIKQDLSDFRGKAQTLLNLGVAQYRLGRFNQARKYGRKALKLTQEVDQRRVEAAGLIHVAGIHQAVGRYEQARENLQRAKSICRDVGMVDRLLMAFIRDLNTILSSRFDSIGETTIESDAHDLLSEMEQMAEDVSNRDYKIQYHLVTARFDICQMNLESANHHLGEALNVLEQTDQDPQEVPRVLMVTSELRRAEGRDEDARETAKQLIQVAEASQEIPYQARGHYLAGNVDKAKELAKSIQFHNLLDRIEAEDSPGVCRT